MGYFWGSVNHIQCISLNEIALWKWVLLLPLINGFCILVTTVTWTWSWFTFDFSFRIMFVLQEASHICKGALLVTPTLPQCTSNFIWIQRTLHWCVVGSWIFQSGSSSERYFTDAYECVYSIVTNQQNECRSDKLLAKPMCVHVSHRFQGCPLA